MYKYSVLQASTFRVLSTYPENIHIFIHGKIRGYAQVNFSKNPRIFLRLSGFFGGIYTYPQSLLLILLYLFLYIIYHNIETLWIFSFQESVFCLCTPNTYENFLFRGR